MSDEMRFDLCDGKYTYVLSSDYKQRALRYGEEWRQIDGDKFVLAMASELAEWKARAERAEAALRPFAEIAEKFPEDDDSEGICGVLLGDLRRARAVLTQIEKETGDE